MTTCKKCGKDKEPTRANSNLCRACDAASRAKRNGGPRTAQRKLTISLPVEVWDRLDAEAVAKGPDGGKRIAGYLRHLIIKRDERGQKS